MSSNNGSAKNGSTKKDDAETFSGLRSMVFANSSKTLGLTLPRNEPFGAVMEMGMGGTVVTFVALADGTVSMYVRGGTSVIGAGTHEDARRAGSRFIGAAIDHSAAMTPTDSHPLPEQGQVRFYLLRDAGHLAWEMPMPTTPNDPLPPLFVAGNDLITQIRLASARFEEEEAKKRGQA